MGKKENRRQFLEACSYGLFAHALLPVPNSKGPSAQVIINPKPLFRISPYLYMQFMEPLGVTDGSVAAAWDYDRDTWRPDFVETVKDLAPCVIRFGGLFSRYYKWREGVGPAGKRPLMRNFVWGGYETNRVGTQEFVALCRTVGAEPLYCVNFLSDGRRRYLKAGRSADAHEAADWVSYANDPSCEERKIDGHPKPYNIKLWQLGNETSYGNGGFTCDEAIKHTREFAIAMKRRDPSVQLIGWGDRQRPGSQLWAGDLLDRTGEYLEYVAIHMMGQHPRRKNTVLRDLRYEHEPERAWEEMLELSNTVEARVRELEEVLASKRSSAGIAVTEGHLSLRPMNTNHILREWMSAVYHARSMNIYQRHGAKVKIATAADFCGTRWTTNAVMIQVPRGASYLLPAGAVMRLFRKYNGTHAVTITKVPSELDIAASRSENQVFLHVANLSYSKPVDVQIQVTGHSIEECTVVEIAPPDLRQYSNEDRPNAFHPAEKIVPSDSTVRYQFPAGSVSVVILNLIA